jgi:hypothetical protein
MWALDQPYTPRADRLSTGTPLTLLAVLALGAAAAVLVVQLGALPPGTVRVVGVTAGHGALLATALAWVGVGTLSQVLAVALIGLASAAAWAAPLGALAYLMPAFWILWLVARGQLTGLGLGTPVSPRGVMAGALIGAGLSSHLLISVSRTLGVQVRVDHAPDVMAAIAYDVGANVLAAECFFRGALFNRAQRRWSFASAAILATAAYVLRYVVDPLLPKHVELVVGAVFYLALLGAANCWLLWWSESLVPGLVSALLFFAAYRTLGAG